MLASGKSRSSMLALLVFLATILIYPITVFLLDYRDLCAATGFKMEHDVIAYFGCCSNDNVHYRGTTIPTYGWNQPNRPIGYKVLVYERLTSRYFFIYINEQGEVEYVFTSRR